MNSETVRVMLAGIGGYGESYVDALLNLAQGKNIRLVAAVDPSPERCSRLEALKAAGVRLYATLDEALRQGTAELVINATPIHLHRPLTCAALARGANVLCEKPLAATIQEALEMQTATRQAGCFTAIGYQWSFSDAVQALKADVLAGTFGRPVRLKTFVSWPRTEAYYRRSAWAGALKTRAGEWVLDSPLNNATAHYFNNMLYLLGDAPDTAAAPAEIQAELYRANPVENNDTAMLRCRTTAGTELLFYTSHAVPSVIGPLFAYEFEHAVIEFDACGPDRPGGRRFGARFRDGRVLDYGNPNDTALNKLWQSVDCVRSGATPLCGIEACIPHTLCVNGAQDSAGTVTVFPAAGIRCESQPGNDRLTWMDGLQATMQDCYRQGVLPSELGTVAWARAGQRMSLEDYTFFPAGKAPQTG